jgi:hypothetical protein
MYCILYVGRLEGPWDSSQLLYSSIQQIYTIQYYADTILSNYLKILPIRHFHRGHTVYSS